MCGLVGIAGNCTVNMKDVFTELLFVDALRGPHSTGTALIKRENSKVMLAKAPLASPQFIGTKEYKDLMLEVGVKAIIGHNRYATVGDKNEKNSHPFKFENIVGAHNGTLDHWTLRELPNWRMFGTDSEAIFNAINKNGLKPTIKSISGAWALTWFEKSSDTINLLRNDKRPLYYTYSEDRETLFWASESEMLEWVLKRNRVKILEKTIYQIEENVHYTWKLPKSLGDKFEKPLVEKVEGSSFTRAVNYGYGGKDNDDLDYYPPGYSYGYDPQYKSSKTDVAVIEPKPKAKYKPKMIIDTTKFRPPYKDHYGHVINKVQFSKLVSSGCVFCEDTTSHWGDFIHCLKDDMDNRKLYLCEDCYNDTEIREMMEYAL